MSAFLCLSPAPRGPRWGFARALLLAVALEGLVAAGLMVVMAHADTPPPGVAHKPMAVHFVTLPAPKPPPPAVVPRPQPRPVHQPPPMPRPRPVVHHNPVAEPLPPPPPRPQVVPRPPAPVPQPPPAPRLSPAAVEGVIDRYAAALHAHIQGALVVPGPVAALGLSGAVTVRFAVSPGGRLLWVRVARSSGIGSIDRAGVAAVRHCHYPPFTKGMPGHVLVFRVRVGINRGHRRY